jgi:RHS repeat-associated protein
VLAVGQRSTTTYDAAGNVASTTDYNGQTIGFAYDTNNRLTTETFSDGVAVSFTYTPTGQRATVTDSRGLTTYAYDLRDRLLSRTDPDGTTISYTYDAAGNRTSVSIPAGTTTYTYDALNRLATVVDPDRSLTRYTYDDAGNLVHTDLPNGTSETRQYDVLNRLVYLEDDGPSGVISSYRYTLAKTGRRDAVVEDAGRRVDYTYDALDRLIEEKTTDAINGNRTIDYTYDPAGNRLTRNDSAEGLTTSTYDDNDRLLTETINGQVTSYTYDNNGNATSKYTSAVDQAIYEWDAGNRLIGAKVTDATGTNTLSYRYDFDGIRVASVMNSAETRFLVDANLPFAQVLAEYTPGGVIQVSYVYGNDLISRKESGVLSYYHVDGLGSTRALTDTSGLVTDRYIYDAFGRMLAHSGGSTNTYRYAGEQKDGNLGLYYLRARYLSVDTGRFFGRDPLDGYQNNPISLTRYLYAGANPANATDPSGQQTLIDVAITLAIISVIFSLPNALGGLLSGAAPTLDDLEHALQIDESDTLFTILFSPYSTGSARAFNRAVKDRINVSIHTALAARYDTLAAEQGGKVYRQQIIDAAWHLTDDLRENYNLTPASQFGYDILVFADHYLISRLITAKGGPAFIFEAGVEGYDFVKSLFEAVGHLQSFPHAGNQPVSTPLGWVRAWAYFGAQTGNTDFYADLKLRVMGL